MTLLVRDEIDIVAANIDYHLARGVDFIIATDNLSTDGTREVLESYRAKGVLHLILESEDNYAQHRWVTRMARLAHTDFRADWVINNDADEFWWPQTAPDLKQALQALPEHAAAASAGRNNFVPRPQTTGADFVGTMIVRETRSLNALGEALPPKACHRARADIEVAQGNHAVSVAGTPIEAIPAPLEILHFPLRTYSRFANKIALGGAAYERNPGLAGQGGTWRMLYEKLRRSELESYYREQELGDAQLEHGLALGHLVEDRRLLDFMQRRAVATPSSP
jgi:hypothetical protein